MVTGGSRRFWIRPQLAFALMIWRPSRPRLPEIELVKEPWQGMALADCGLISQCRLQSPGAGRINAVMVPQLSSLDHLVLTVVDLPATIAFYRDVLGMTPIEFTPAGGTPRWALKFGTQKINLHVSGAEFAPKAAASTPGSADLCFLSAVPLDRWQAHLTRANISIEQDPVRRTGAMGHILSLYLRDPDGNLFEISNRLEN